MKGFASSPQMLRQFLHSVGWFFAVLFSLEPLRRLGAELSDGAFFTFYAVSVAPLIWWTAKTVAGVRRPAFPWPYGKAQSARIYAAYLTPVLPLLAWHLTHPLFLRLGLLQHESAVEEWLLFFYGLTLLLGARSITTHLIFWFPLEPGPDGGVQKR